MVSERPCLSPQVLRASSTYLSPLGPSSCRVAPHSLLSAGQETPALHAAGPGGPGGAQQGPEPSGPGCRERPLHHQAHELLPVGRSAPGPRPAGLLPLLTALKAQRRTAGRGGQSPVALEAPQTLMRRAPSIPALPAQPPCFQNGKGISWSSREVTS